PRALSCILMRGYAFAAPYMPDVVAHKGVSLSKAVSHYWLTTEGVFGVALGVSASYIFLFVLFGSLLERPAPATTSSRWRSRCSATCAADRPRRRWSRRG